ncbi:MAG: HD-GYP domain-containing protein, partial [Proteobacteria bacterium]|nr:HD-GYP domain-containing protein [Pseudomonadota bacterium]
MNSFDRRTAVRITIVSLLLAAVASPIAGFVAHEQAEQATIALAVEESGRLLHHLGPIALSGPLARENADKAAALLTGGLFDIAEIYDLDGLRLATAMTADGRKVEAQLPGHLRPMDGQATDDGFRLADGRWVLRVFVPLRGLAGGGAVAGYFEGVRVVSAWQQREILHHALATALMVGLASLLCGLAIYPVVVHLSADNERKTREILDSHLSMMEALGRAIAKRDSDTGAHNFRVAWIATRIAERLGLRERAIQSLIVGSFLHDVGKISIPDAILLKPGALDARETEIMHTHVAHGEEIVTGIGWLDEAVAVVAAHHEKWDGSGYPRRLSGDGIPLPARIFAVADAFDALCSRRPYKEAMGFDTTMSILQRDTARHFDPEVMAAFTPIAREIFERLAAAGEDDT